MPCYHPMVLINTSDMSDPKQREMCEAIKNKHLHDERFKSASTIIIPRELAENEGIRLRECGAVVIPCGRCIGCRLDYSRQWAERSVHEAECHEYNYFLTLTYDDDHLPIGSKGVPTLVKKEMSDFMKNLRETFRREYGISGIRFFGCGEYGEGLRPHLHIILFNCPIPDLQERHPIPVDGKIKLIKQYDSNNQLLLYSPTIGKIWKKGSCPIGQVTFESCAYVARYVVKKKLGKDGEDYEACGIIPPFVNMSRRPGIGEAWYMTHLHHIYEYDNVSFKRGDRVINMKPGRYCDKLYKKHDEQAFYDLKKRRRLDFYDGVDCKTFEGVDLSKNNHASESEKEHSIKLLKRTL